ncbi:hypothetical protein [Candidatus Spongiihabitans sp.]|uniref:hypothetical protein n=1 Tax=Candidatus Spongiihabitans sp. TaxID=3101308 RepID=UPI003C7E6091
MKKTPETNPTHRDDLYTQGIMAALMRAVRRAHLVAHQTGTGVIVRRNGKVVEIDPDPDMYEKHEEFRG